MQADALEHALMAALPLGPQSAAGGVTLPDSFRGELQVGLLHIMQPYRGNSRLQCINCCWNSMQFSNVMHVVSASLLSTQIKTRHSCFLQF